MVEHLTRIWRHKHPHPRGGGDSGGGGGGSSSDGAGGGSRSASGAAAAGARASLALTVQTAVRDFIRGDPLLNNSILMMQPLDLDAIHTKLRGAGIACGDKQQLAAFLRKDNVVVQFNVAARAPLAPQPGRSAADC